MKTRSFQLRIALTSVFLSGLCLCVFGGCAWTFFYRMSLDRIDQEIVGRGNQELSKFRQREEWERFENALRFIFGERERESFLLLVKDREGKTLHKSANWPSDLNPGSFPTPATNELIPLDRAGRRGRIALQAVERPRPDSDRPEAPQEFPDVRFQAIPRLHTQRLGFQSWRIGVMGNEHATLVMGINLDGFQTEMRRARTAFLTALPGALLIVALGAWLMSRRALRPIRSVTATAKSITAQGLDHRIERGTEDVEFEELVTVLNQMLDSLQSSFQQAVRFSADAAHELKTPLTILQGELENALQKAGRGSAGQLLLNGLLEEVQRLKTIVHKLLLLSQADSGQLVVNRERRNLTELVEEILEDVSILAPHLTIRKELAPEVWAEVDVDLIRQALQNLTSNAIKYNQENGLIEFRLSRDDSWVRFSIANTGEPIPEEHQKRLFDRFYRADKSRGRRIDGVGLGLSLSREIARAHSGDLVLDELVDGIVSFTMTLPSTS